MTPTDAARYDQLRVEFGSGKCHVPQTPEPTELPFWRYDPEPECEHGATVTSYAAVWTHDAHGDVDIVATTRARVTACLDCHAITAPQEEM